MRADFFKDAGSGRKAVIYAGDMPSIILMAGPVFRSNAKNAFDFLCRDRL